MKADKLRFRFKTRAARLAKLLLLGYLFFAPAAVFGKNLSEYRSDVKEAKVLIADLLAPDLEDKSFQDYLKLERETLAKIRARIPASEKIEWQGSSVETNNQWLIKELSRFETEPPESAKRETILIELSERLEAIEGKLAELENPSASIRTKDEDKQKLAEILRREEYQHPEEKQESLFTKIYRKIMDWLARLLPRPNISAPTASGGFQSFSFVLQMLLYALILSAIGFLIYRFAPFLASRFRTREKREKKERVILGERLSADETSRNLFDEAERLAREGNLRGAIRKGYIAFLCELSERKIIGLSQHKTNRDYLRDVRQQNELYANMSGLTNNYERHWYGFDDAEQTDWEEFRAGYQKAIESR